MVAYLRNPCTQEVEALTIRSQPRLYSKILSQKSRAGDVVQW
jgi:hypothetical protein